MAQLVVIYKTPADAAAFDAYYRDSHIPTAKKIPGLKRYDISSGPVASPQGDSGVHLIAILHFDTMADLQAALTSPEGQAAAGDLANFASGGAEFLIFDTAEV